MIARDTVVKIEAIECDAWLDMYEAAPAAVRERLGLMQRRADDGALLICRAVDHPQFNRLAYLGVTQPARGETLDAALADFAKAGVKNFVVHVAPGAEPLARLCTARHLTIQSLRWAKFVRDAAPPPRFSSSLTVREVRPDGARAFGVAAAAGFGLPAEVGEWVAALCGRPRWRCFAAYAGATAVAAGSVYIDGDCAWLGIGATIPAQRGLRAHLALLAARIEAAIAAGCTLLTTETGIPHGGDVGPSFVNIQRAGFAAAYARSNYYPG
ncbi:MAG: hypothetical protein ACREB8_04880 [Pseudolabrys sp.]